MKRTKRTYVTLFWPMSKGSRDNKKWTARERERRRLMFVFSNMYISRRRRRKMIVETIGDCPDVAKSKRDNYFCVNVALHCDPVFDIRTIVDRSHLLLYWYDQRTALEMIEELHRRYDLSSVHPMFRVPVSVTLPVVNTLSTAFSGNLTVAPGWISGS